MKPFVHDIVRIAGLIAAFAAALLALKFALAWF